jgi:glycosyltransferase involved in cell wall biosynthesis
VRRVAIVHERFTEFAGSERVVAAMLARWPEATVLAPIVDRTVLPPELAKADVRDTWLARGYRTPGRYAHLLPLLPLAFRHLDLDGFDLVVTSHHAFANRVAPPPGVPVVSYTHTPARWMWDPRFLRAEIGGVLGRTGLRAFAATQRGPDRRAARRARGIVANSRCVARRIREWWGRESVVVHPPVDTGFFTPAAVPREDFFLLAGRLVPYKRPTVAVRAAREAGMPLVVAGDGRARDAVAAAAGPGIELVGAVDDDALRDLYRRCRALVFPGEEDFGIVPVEAQACGTPVVAAALGGVRDSVIDGVTGVLYPSDGSDDEGDAARLSQVLRAFDPTRFDADRLRAHAAGFGTDRFVDEIGTTVDALAGGGAGAGVGG